MIKPVVYVRTPLELEKFVQMGGRDFIIAPRALARFGQTGLQDIFDLARYALQMNLKLAMEWDVLMTENIMREAIQMIQQMPMEAIGAIRVQDLGALEYVLQYMPKTNRFQVVAGDRCHSER